MSISAEIQACTENTTADDRLNQAIAECLPHFGRLSEQLRQTSAQIESSVIGVCGSFQAIAERARAAVTQTSSFLETEASEKSAKRSFDSLVSSCSQTLVKTLEASEEAAETAERAIERVTNMEEISNNICKTLEKLENVARASRMLAMNARIEATHAGELGAGFNVVAVEVASQSNQVRELASHVDTLTTHLREQASTTVADLHSIAQRERQRLEQSRSEVEATLEDLRAAHQEMKQELASMNEQSALLASDIGSAVREMQFQDRVSQQIAHVVQDLETLQAKLVSSEDGGGAPSFSSFTMREEREIAGMSDPESAAGDVELF
jgi:methyl-accepting chemotaxis protein